ncbi:MAG: hypothetical protein IKU59_06695 [Bacteroidales bacterium]|nr:hypothetical protein [Bacteroidales bacterium]
MKELKEIRFNDKEVLLKDNLVRGTILPEKISELNRNIIFKGDTIVEGAIYGYRIEIQEGDLELQGAVFAQNEFYINSDAKGVIKMKKSVASSNSVVSRSSQGEVLFYSDINAKSVSLRNAFVAGSIYADEIILEDCVVVGGVFATQTLEIRKSMVGTFYTPSVKVLDTVYFLLPSAFSIEKMISDTNTKLYNLSLADLGSLYKGLPESENSGKIEIFVESDEIKSKLTNEEVQKTLRSYTVIGKVLAADLVDFEKFNNHFLLTAASLGSQLLRTYDMGIDANGEKAILSVEKIKEFLFKILDGKISVREMDGKFKISDITGKE